MPLNFTAIDFETANNAAASACSVGLVKVRDGRVVDKAGWLIRPPLGFDHVLEWNTRIHGITAADIVDDMGVLRAACEASRLETPDLRYLCSLRVARKTYHLDSYKLPVAAMAAGFEDFAHHDALADAEACAAIIVHAAKRHDVSTMEDLARITGGGLGLIGPAAEAAAADRRPAVLG